MKDMDLIVQFAMLWGETIVSTNIDRALAATLSNYNSEEVLEILTDWKDEYLSDTNGESDTYEFFIEKLESLHNGGKKIDPPADSAVMLNNYHGVTIYHVHKDGVAENPITEFYYSLKPGCSEDSEDAFDIRKIEYDGICYNHANILCELIDDGYFSRADKRSEKESEAGVCPICGHKELEYGETDWQDDVQYRDVVCRNCEMKGEELHRLQFIGFEIF